MVARNPQVTDKGKKRVPKEGGLYSGRLSPGDRLQLIFDDLERDAPPAGDDGWEVLEAMLNEGRPRDAQLFRKKG